MRPETIAIHSGFESDPATHAVAVPIYQTAAYVFDSADHATALFNLEEEGYRCQGVAGMVALTGDIEGRIILDLEPQTALRVASHYAGAALPESDGLIKETIFELANQVVGNAVCALNDQGFHFRVHPPLLLTCEDGDKTSEDVEALMICFETSLGNVFMNVALRHNKRRMSDHAKMGA